jgi:aminopeptidase N
MVSVGTRLSKDPDPEDRNAMVTRYRMTHPVALVTFAFGAFDPKTKEVTFEAGGKPIPVTFNLVRGQQANPDFFLGELDNAVRYFSAMFGPYPYETFSAAMHPFGFGQGFATLLMIAPAQRTGVNVRDSDVYSFLAHETAHQWWGNIVAWRSYRDQWLSEGFAEYSGLLYAARRDRDALRTTMDMVRALRDSLREMPRTVTGGGKGRLNDIGPIIQGLRLHTTQTAGAYQTLIYNKGALVLRMLHFLMSNPTNGNDAAFIAMMKDFVEKYRDGAARTEDFWSVASQHFARTPIAQKFGLANLDWFFRQWVYDTGLPSYQMEWEFKTHPDGTTTVAGVVKQDGVAPDWIMVLPLVMSFDGNQEARTTVRAAGPSTPFEIRVPVKPRKVELDPFSWVLSERTTSRGK